jgi:hypothetical protein
METILRATQERQSQPNPKSELKMFQTAALSSLNAATRAFKALPLSPS